MFHNNQTKSHWESKDYSATLFNKNNNPSFLIAMGMLPVLAQSDAVLDVGCGDGRIAAAIAKRVPNGSVVGFDVSGKLIEHAKEQYKNVDNLSFFQSSAQNIALEKEKFNLIFSSLCLHWVEPDKLPDVFKQLSAALKPEGKFIVSIGLKHPGIFAAIEELMCSSEWKKYFENFCTTYTFYETDFIRQILDESGLMQPNLHVDKEYYKFPAINDFLLNIKSWMPYFSYVPNDLQDEFLKQVGERYLQLKPDAITTDGIVFEQHVLKVEALKPKLDLENQISARIC